MFCKHGRSGLRCCEEVSWGRIKVLQGEGEGRESKCNAWDLVIIVLEGGSILIDKSKGVGGYYCDKQLWGWGGSEKWCILHSIRFLFGVFTKVSDEHRVKGTGSEKNIACPRGWICLKLETQGFANNLLGEDVKLFSVFAPHLRSIYVGSALVIRLWKEEDHD